MADWLTKSTDAAIAKLDAIRARRLGTMLVTGADEMKPEQFPLVDMASFDPKTMLEQFNAQQGRYATTPFDPQGSRLRLFPGGVTIWSGFPGHGKTTLLRQLACHLLHRNESVFFASLEEHPRDLVIRVASSAAGMPVCDVERLTWFCDWYSERFRVWGVLGLAKASQMLGAIKVTKCTHAIVDSLMCLDIDNDDWNQQRVFVNTLAALARETGTHIHLVAHPKKPVAGNQEPSLNDVAGAADIGRIADNVVFVRRSSDEKFGDLQTGMKILILKQRHGTGAIGDVTGWFRREWHQFVIDQFQSAPTRYLPADAYA